MDLFDILFISTHYNEFRQAQRIIEEDNRIIPSWLFREEPSQSIFMGQIPFRIPHQQPPSQENLPTRLDLPEPVPPASAWTPLIPAWLFQNEEEEIENLRRQNSIRIEEMLNQFDILMRGLNSAREPTIRGSGICMCGYCNKIEPVKFTDTKEKHIDEGRNAECPITYEEIKDGDTYLTCDACKYNFSESAIVKHLNGSRKRDCPMCRAEWTNYCKYVNKDTKREMREKVKNLIDTIKVPIIDNSINKKDLSILTGEVVRTKHNKRWFYGK